MIYALALLIGVIAGLRAMIAPAAVGWLVATRALPNIGWSWLSFFGWRWTPWIFTALAAVELVTDQLPSTPSRKVPVQFGTRIVMGGLSGAAIGVVAGSWPAGMALGAVGAVIGTLGGANLRARMAAAFGSDRPAALIEDAVAIIGAVLIVSAL